MIYVTNINDICSGVFFLVILVLILIFNLELNFCLSYLDNFSEDGHYVDRNDNKMI